MGCISDGAAVLLEVAVRLLAVCSYLRLLSVVSLRLRQRWSSAVGVGGGRRWWVAVHSSMRLVTARRYCSWRPCGSWRCVDTCGGRDALGGLSLLTAVAGVSEFCSIKLDKCRK